MHTTTRVPVDDQYVALVGKAVYVFAYYEWAMIWIIELMENGFVGKYSRVEKLKSKDVGNKLQKIIQKPTTNFSKVSKQALQDCCDKFKKLIIKRNALIHAHPCTDSDGSQILSYQTKTTEALPDMKWPKHEVEAIISEFDLAACAAGTLLDRLR